MRDRGRPDNQQEEIDLTCLPLLECLMLLEVCRALPEVCLVLLLLLGVELQLVMEVRTVQ